MIMCMNNEGEYGKYIIQESILPPYMRLPEVKQEYHENGRRRVLWLDDNAAPGGGFTMNSAWIVHADCELQMARRASNTVLEIGMTHSHESNEIVGFLGSNPDDPSDLCGEIEFFIEGEQHILTKSTYIYLPAGVIHMPMTVNRVDRPIFHFFITMTPGYVMVLEKGKFEVNHP